ncbi:hypothetical protein FQA39_LY08522 [Lamprigera yunnana]|nr:hypothetical protein FQA39_LY08522 [Lamprigera yunnana]
MISSSSFIHHELLQSEWQKAANEVEQMKTMIANLEATVKNLQNDSNHAQIKQSVDDNSPAKEYFTDEEELAKETEYIRVRHKNNKKRKTDSSLTPPVTTTREL